MLADHHQFRFRHIGPDATEQKDMLDYLGIASLSDLMEKALPDAIKFEGDSKLPDAISEDDALERLREIGSKNRITQSFIGLGYYGTRTPGVIKRNVLENPSWYTAYTPYQPEISQGRLEAINYRMPINYRPNRRRRF